MSSVENLVKLGLNRNEAKALDALITLGPVGAADVHRFAEIPRNKAYESLEKLANRGMVEVQKGRPTLYRAIGAKVVIDNLVETYEKEAKQALGMLEKKQEQVRDEEGGNFAAYAWMVRGEQGVKRRLAELIYAAETDIFAIGGYPPKYFLSAQTALRAAAKRGVKTRPVSMINPMQGIDESSLPDDRSIIEFRTVKASPTMKLQPYDDKLVGGFAGMRGAGAMLIIDESIAFDIVDDGKDPRTIAGIVFKVPGIPRIQKATVERILGLYTRKF